MTWARQTGVPTGRPASRAATCHHRVMRATDQVPDWYIDARVGDGMKMPARGERDELLPRADGDALAVAIPGSRLVDYPDTGHLVLWEQPARVASDLTAFVNDLP